MLSNEIHKIEDFKFYSINELKDLPKINWRIEGLLPSFGIGAIYGASGSTKSFLVLDLALHLASKNSWFGYEIKKNIPVYFIALEGEAGIPQRIAAWLKKYEIDKVENFKLSVYQSFLMNKIGDVEKLITTIKKDQKDECLIVIDTFNQSNIGVDENSSKEISTSLNNLKEIAKETNSLVLFVHHSGKDETKGLRGSSSILAALDISIHVKSNSKETTWEIDKFKDARGNIKHSYQLDEIELDYEDEFISSCVIKPNCEEYKKQPTGSNQKLVLETFETLLGRSQQYVSISNEDTKVDSWDELIEDVKVVEWDELIKESNKGLVKTKEHQKSYIIRKVLDQMIDKKHIKIHKEDGKVFVYK